MVTNYYNAATNCKTPIRREPKPYTEIVTKCDDHPMQKPARDADLVIILGLLAVLFLTDCKDRLLMMALLYLAFG